MCKCYLYIVCTLVFCQKEFLQCSITALTAREHRRHGIKKKKKDRAVCFLHSLSEVWSVQGWGFWEFLRGHIFLVAVTEKAPHFTVRL